MARRDGGRERRHRISRTIDNAFFVIAGIASLWLSYLVFRQGLTAGWGQVWFSILLWLLVAYVTLPRLHRILTEIYVPDYFIGRTRTSDGLLGDPVNIALLGEEDQVHTVMREAGWTRADEVTLQSGIKIVRSTILRRSYDQAPVSPLMLFGRNQDFAYQQEVAGNPAKRHHVRFWRCPEGWRLPGGQRADWLAAGTYDRAVGFSLFTLQVTHKIAANTDEERDHVVGVISGADRAVSVTLLRDFATGYHARNGGGDSIVTDGDLPVVDLREVVPAAAAADESAEPVATPRRRHPGTPDKVSRRPSPTVFGATVVLLRSLTPLVVVLGALAGWDGIRTLLLVDDGSGESLTQAEIQPLAVAYIIGAIVFLVWEGALGLLVLFGSNTARVLVMLSSVGSIIVTGVAYFEGRQEITLATNLVALSLDILILTALSSSRARDYAHRRRSRKRAQTAAATPAP
ncbi:LssY C-terminal domain-containing protein [Amnibacterium flavum]|uniref:LssY-like C-terminal domain-containing protein n=1 Tax=Amnibacterium flavum TaxID=2173173 RepID=A0A2V1HNR6_9MICO|nr:LssY C-terminal domain-containing protein [Amnibacterium flavum]PVZ94155.1 hypothetical protein DDQ50_10440 [Amnibacterium flavum]